MPDTFTPNPASPLADAPAAPSPPPKAAGASLSDEARRLMQLVMVARMLKVSDDESTEAERRSDCRADQRIAEARGK